jgi:hypothetical protein
MAKIIAVDLDEFEKEFKQVINGYKAQHWVIKPHEVEQIIEKCMEAAVATPDNGLKSCCDFWCKNTLFKEFHRSQESLSKNP